MKRVRRYYLIIGLSIIFVVAVLLLNVINLFTHFMRSPSLSHASDEHNAPPKLKNSFNSISKKTEKKRLMRNSCAKTKTKTLVMVIGHCRASYLTWQRIQRHVLDALCADLAVFMSCDIDEDPLVDMADYSHLYSDREWNLPKMLDKFAKKIGKSPREWRYIEQKMGGRWLGGLYKHPSKALLVAIQKYLLLEWKPELFEEYDSFVITRSDHFWVTDHPPIDLLSQKHVYTLSGNEWGGVNDRHMVCPQTHIRTCLNTLESLIGGIDYYKFLQNDDLRYWMQDRSTMFPEEHIKTHLDMNHVPICPMPVSSFLTGDGNYTHYSDQPKCCVEGYGVPWKYDTEVESALQTKKILGKSKDWSKLLFDPKNCGK